MVDVISKDKIIDVDDVSESKEKDAEIVELVDTGDVSGELVEVSEEPLKEDSKESETKDAEIPKNIPLSEFEYSSLSKTLTTITRLKATLKENPHSETQDQINFLEVSILDDIVKRFGFSSVESAQEKGYTFNIKAMHVVECNKRETQN